MTKSERTKQFIIEKTAPVFNMYGFEGASLAVLQQVTGLTKGSLYGNFRDKEEMAVEAFRFSMSTIRDAFQAKIKKQKTAKGKLLTFLGVYAGFVRQPPVAGGCPILNNAIEADDFHTSMKEVVAEEIERTIDFITSLFEQGKSNGEFVAHVRSRELAYLLFTSIEGAIMVSRVSGTETSMRAVVKHYKQILNSISK